MQILFSYSFVDDQIIDNGAHLFLVTRQAKIFFGIGSRRVPHPFPQWPIVQEQFDCRRE